MSIYICYVDYTPGTQLHRNRKFVIEADRPESAYVLARELTRGLPGASPPDISVYVPPKVGYKVNWFDMMNKYGTIACEKAEKDLKYWKEEKNHIHSW